MDKEMLRRLVRRKMEERMSVIVEELHRFQTNPCPQTTLEVEKGLHAESARMVDAIFAEALRQMIVDPSVEAESVAAEKKKPPRP